MSARYWPAGEPERQALRFVLAGLGFLLFLAFAALWSVRIATGWALGQADARLVVQAVAVAEGMAEHPRSLSAPGAVQKLRLGGALQAGLYGDDGVLLEQAAFLPDSAGVPAQLPQDLLPRGTSPRSTWGSGLEEGLIFVAVPLKGGEVLRIAFDGSAAAAARRNLSVLTWVIPTGALALVALTVPFYRRILTPLHNLSRTAQKAGGLLDATAAAPPPPPAEAVATFARTIDQLRQRTEQLEELRRREKARADALASTYDTLIRAHPGGLLAVDGLGRLSDASPPARRALYLPDDAVGNDANEALSSIPELTAAVQAAMAGVPTLSREIRSGTAPGGRVLAVTAVPMAEADGRRLGCLVFLDDLSSVKALERELAMRREMAALGEMSAGIAHEFRNATATILGYARLAASARDDAERARYLDGVRSEAEHVVKVTGDFLLFARPERVVRSPLDLGALAADVVAEERMSAGAVELEVDGQLGQVEADPALLRRALVNLVRNAREAAVSSPAPRVRITGRPGPDGTTLLTVEDSGPGIPDERVPKLFVPFATTKEAGTGLGLSLVGKIVTLHGGTIRVERSEALGGAAFVVSLPVGPA